MFSLITARRVSLLIVLAYASCIVVAGLASTRPAREVVITLLLTVPYFVFPLACIWFGDEMGEYVGTFPGPAINRRTPGWMVKLGGWFLLLLPAIILLFSMLNS